MKKIVVFLFVVMAALTAKAQVYVGGSISLWHDDDDDATTFMLAPEVGSELTEKWSVGAELMLSHSKQKVGEHGDKLKWTGFAFAPYARYTFFENKILRAFIDGCIGVSTQKYKGGDSTAGFELGVKPGLAIKLTDHFSLVTKYGFLGYRDDYMLGAGNGYGFNFSSEDLSIGFHYTF